ncbi:MAG TPA: hypothetical protein VL625_04395 [Patescibacteria group bacterium]|nr:hypothetical protein [Patescibacteria group bacterium]
MPSYRGVDKKDIVDSVRQAAAYLKRLNLGPVTNQTIDRMLGAARIDTIDRARTDSELRHAIKSTNVSSAMMMFMKVLRFHALTDAPAPGRGESEALKIYRKLHLWGAFPPGNNAVTSMMEPEFREHLMPRSLKILAALDDKAEAAALTRLEAFVSGLRGAEIDHGEKGERARWLIDSVPLIINLTKIGGMDNEITSILDANPKASPAVPDALEVMLDLNTREETLGVEPAIRPYRIAIGKLPEDDDERETVIIQMLRRIQDVMQSHLNRDEMLYNAATETNRSTGEVYVVILATRSAARYLAEHSDYPILDQNGNRLPGSSPPGSGLGPRPGF